MGELFYWKIIDKKLSDTENSWCERNDFFLATGFHGLHVLIGTSFLTVCLIRHINNLFSRISTNAISLFKYFFFHNFFSLAKFFLTIIIIKQGTERHDKVSLIAHYMKKKIYLHRKKILKCFIEMYFYSSFLMKSFFSY